MHYMCSYMAMFSFESPHYFIEGFTKKGDQVIASFSGRGATAYVASAQSRFGIRIRMDIIGCVIGLLTPAYRTNCIPIEVA